jgi:hypothetical protein
MPRSSTQADPLISAGNLSELPPLMTLREYLERRSRKVLIPGAVVVLPVWAFVVTAPQQSAWTARAPKNFRSRKSLKRSAAYTNRDRIGQIIQFTH